jgi:hypothetical protein
MCLNIMYIYRCVTKTMHLEKPECLIIWNGESNLEHWIIHLKAFLLDGVFETQTRRWLVEEGVEQMSNTYM